MKIVAGFTVLFFGKRELSILDFDIGATFYGTDNNHNLSLKSPRRVLKQSPAWSSMRYDMTTMNPPGSLTRVELAFNQILL